MLEQGILTPSEVRGIYRVNGLTKLPYQIVIAQELEGRERRLPRLERPRKYSGHIGDNRAMPGTHAKRPRPKRPGASAYVFSAGCLPILIPFMSWGHGGRKALMS